MSLSSPLSPPKKFLYFSSSQEEMTELVSVFIWRVNHPGEKKKEKILRDLLPLANTPHKQQFLSQEK